LELDSDTVGDLLLEFNYEGMVEVRVLQQGFTAWSVSWLIR
jgi:hypothetical protein